MEKTVCTNWLIALIQSIAASSSHLSISFSFFFFPKMSNFDLLLHNHSPTPKHSHSENPLTISSNDKLFPIKNIVQISSSHSSDSGPVIPTTPLVNFLERVQETALQTFGKSNFDPKLYVDLSLKHELSAAEDGFDGLNRGVNNSVSVDDLRDYLGKYFEGAGEDLVNSEPEDFVPEPEGFLPKVKNQQVRKWALEVHSLWKNLSRKVSDEVRKQPELHTLLPLPHPVMIPGSRFREVYYWDSYWVIRLVLFMLYITYALFTNIMS